MFKRLFMLRFSENEIIIKMRLFETDNDKQFYFVKNLNSWKGVIYFNILITIFSLGSEISL